MKKKILILLCSVLSALPLYAYTVDEIPNVHLADKTKFVTNPDGIISTQAEARLNATIGDIWEKTSAEVVAVIVKTIGEDEINDFATRLFEHWGIGKQDKSNGLLILVVEDQRKAVIRTGYGAEGLLPDIVCGRIIRQLMVPYFRNGDYDTGMLKATAYIHNVLTTPGAVEELKSKYANDRPIAIDNGKMWQLYSTVAGWVASILLVYVLAVVISTRKKDPYERFYRLRRLLLPSLVLSFVTLGMGLPALAIAAIASKRCRNKRRTCPNCKAKMRKLSETEDNKYLTPAQDLEERLNSVDYDVWLCDKCGEVDVFPFINKRTPYQECPVCHTKAMMLVGDRLIQNPSPLREGKGVKTFRCRNCGNTVNLSYTVPKDEVPVIVPFIGGFGGGSGSGFGGGGSFGGGSTGGGGASGGW